MGYFAIFYLLMFSNISNIFDTISKFTVELKVYVLLFTKKTIIIIIKKNYIKKWPPV